MIPTFAQRRAPAPTRPRRRLSAILAVSVGGALGGGLRHAVDQLVSPSGAGFPWATFAVNVAGALALAVLLVLVLEVWRPTRFVRPFLAVGVLGSFTTFSTWMVEVDQLYGAGDVQLATVHLAGSVVAGVGATSMGLMVCRGVAVRRTRVSRKGRS